MCVCIALNRGLTSKGCLKRQSVLAACLHVPCNTHVHTMLLQRQPLAILSRRFPFPRCTTAIMARAEPKPLNDVFSNLPTTIFEVMTRLSIEHHSLNLGQGRSLSPWVKARTATSPWPACTLCQRT